MDGQAKVSIWLELKNRLRNGLRDARADLKGSLGDIKNDLTDVSSGTERVSSDLGGMATAFGVGAVAANVFLEVGKKVLESIGEIIDKSKELNDHWEEGFQKSNAILQVSQDRLSGYSSRIQEIAKNQSNVPFETVPDAFNELVKSGQNAELAIKNIPAILEAARVGFTDAGSAAHVTADIMNAGNFKDASTALDYMFATMHKGNIDFKQTGTVLPRIILSARDAHVQINEAAAALATLTSKGIAPDQAGTMLDEAFRLFGDKKRSKSFKDLGIKLFDKKGEMRSLADIAENFHDVMASLRSDKDKDAVLDFLGLDKRSARGFLTLAQDAGLLRENISAANNSTGALETTSSAVEDRFKNWKEFTNSISGSMNDLGDYLNDIKAETGDNLIAFKEWVKDSKTMQDIWEGISLTFKGLKYAFDSLKLTDGEINALKNLGFSSENFVLFGKKKEPDWDAEASKYKSYADGGYYEKRKEEEGNKTVQSVVDGFGFLKKSFDKFKYGGLSEDKIAIVKQKETAIYDAKQKTSKSLYDKDGNLILPDEKNKKGDDSGDRIQGNVPRTVNFNIQSVISGDFITKNENFQNMSPKDFEAFLTNIFLRMRHNAETGYN